MALKVLMAPLRYVQGPNALLQMGEQLQVFGIKNPLVLASPSAKKAVGPTIIEGLESKGIGYAFVDFGGHCTWKEIERTKNACIQGGHDAIISCGGGKTLDTGRCAATGPAMNVEKQPPEFFPKFGAGVPCINVPTVAATDASTSAASSCTRKRGHSRQPWFSPQTRPWSSWIPPLSPGRPCVFSCRVWETRWQRILRRI